MSISPDDGAKLNRTLIWLYAYADDILLSNNINTVENVCVRLMEAIQKVDLQINKGKTEYM